MSKINSPRRFAAFLLTTSAIVLAQTASAQNNDVDAYDGTIPTGCALAAIQETPSNDRVGNIVAGSENCIRHNSSHNIVSGNNNHIEPDALYNLVLGHDNRVNRQFGNYNFVHGNNIDVYERYSNLSGHTMTVWGWGNTAHGNNINIASRAEWNAVFGQGHELQRGGDYNLVTGLNNTTIGGIHPVTHYNMIGGTNNTLEGTGNIVAGSSHNFEGHNNLVVGSENTSVTSTGGNLVGGSENNISGSASLLVGTRNNMNGGGANVISGTRNTTGGQSWFNVVSGSDNVMGSHSANNTISGSMNVFGNYIGNSSVMGRENTLAGGVNFPGSLQHMVFGSFNTVTGDTSTLNFIGANNANVEGIGNFVGGGNDVDGPNVTGNNNVVIGALASSVVDDAVAIGSGSAATLSIIAAQGAWAGGTAGSVTFTEGTDAEGGEMNVGDRLLTGVADGRVANGSSDAVNGHQLFEAVSVAASASDCGDGTGDDSQICGDGASAAGDQATALGDNASANFGGSVALGFGSTTSLDVAAAQAAYSGITIGGLMLSEGTDATGGEMNIGNRLLTGVADGRITSGSSDGVNGHQLNIVGTQVDANTSAIDGISTTIGGIQSDITDLENDVSAIEGDITAVEGDIIALQDEVNQNASEIDSNAMDIEANALNIESNSMDIETNATNIESNTMDIEANAMNIEANTINIEANASDIDANTMNIETNTMDIEDNAMGIESNGLDIDANTAIIGANSDAIDANATSIGENSTAIDGLSTGVTDLSDRVATNEGTNVRQDRDVDANKDAITVNTARTQQNAVAILENTNVIAENRGLIERNYALGLSNQESILDLEDGLAAVAALPDMYLSPKAKWAASGGLGLYGESVGVGATLAIRGSDNWAMGASVGIGGSKATGKLQVRYEGF